MTEDSKSGNDKDNPAPEVEAEIVDDGHGASHRDENISAAADPGEPAEDAVGAAPPKTALTPGVILFMVFAIVAGVGYSLWRLQSDEADGSPVSVVESTERASDEAQDAVIALGADQSAMPEIEDVSAADQSAGDDAARGVNDGGAFLPPLPDVSDDTITSAAVADETSADGEPSEIEEAPSESAAPSPDEPSDDAADMFAADPAESETFSSTEIDDVDAGAPSEDPAPSRIANNVDAIKEAFRSETSALSAALDEERRRSASQEEEIASLRQEFRAVLERRDEAANAEFSEMRARLDKIQSGDGIPAGRVVAATIALTALQRKADQGGAFEEELEILARFAPNAAVVERLRPLAGEGAPTLSSLKEDFPPAAVNALAAAGRAKASGIGAAFWSRVKSLVSVRPATPIEGEHPRAIISRAEARLENDDLGAAVTELQALEGPAGEAMAGWLASAERRASISRSIEDLNSFLLNQLQE